MYCTVKYLLCGWYKKKMTCTVQFGTCSVSGTSRRLYVSVQFCTCSVAGTSRR